MSSEEEKVELEKIDDLNEFADFNADNLDMPPTGAQAPTSNQGESEIAEGTGGKVYDWQQAPERARAPPRVDLDGKEVIIEKAELVLPASNQPWVQAKTNDKVFYKGCIFALHYNFEGQQEFFSGVRCFKQLENEIEKLSHPTIQNDRNTQASNLKGVYADFKDKDIKTVSLKEFMSFLNSKPKAVIKAQKFKNPVKKDPKTNEYVTVTKNMIGKFL